MLLRLLPSILYCLISLAAAGDAGSGGATPRPPPLLLVSFDGFRADYLKRFPMPNLKQLYTEGVLVEELTNVFITKTFPNHYSIVTGLYAESHGILASHMYDQASHKVFSPDHDSDPFWWTQAEPLWITAQDSGYKTATAMWPGSDVVIGGRTATHFLPYNPNVTFRQRLGNVTAWLTGNGTEEGVQFATLYWEEPDRSGHHYGPENNTVMEKVLKEVDDNIGLLVSELKRAKLWGRVNVVVMSDHGMAQCSPDRVTRLDDCLPRSDYKLVDTTPVAAIIPQGDPDAVFSKLSKCPHVTAYMKKAIPNRLHYRNNLHIQPIILVADEGWTIVQNDSEHIRLGDHGYDNALPSMHPFLAATGPGFRTGYRVARLQSVDVYPVMCRLLAVPPRPNNGSLAQARCMLAAESCMNLPAVVGLVVGVLLLLSAVTVLFRWLASRRQSAARPFQRLQLDDDFDDDPLLE